jgi:hypothetical protein
VVFLNSSAGTFVGVQKPSKSKGTDDDLTSFASESMVPEVVVKNQEVKKNPPSKDEVIEIVREPEILMNSKIIEPEEDDIERL